MKKCFVVMPFCEPFNEYYAEVIKPAIEGMDINSIRGDEVYSNKPIIDDIIEHIIYSDLIIADVSNKNPNVNYELGIAHALNKQVIIIAQDANDIPFDYRHIRTIIYKTSKAKWADILKNDIQETIRAVTNSAMQPFVMKSLEKFYENIRSSKLLGLRQTFNTRQSMNIYLTNLWKSDIFRLDVMAFGLKSFRDSQSLSVLEKLKKGMKVRILAINPDSKFVAQREKDENLLEGSIRKTIYDLNDWCIQMNRKAQKKDAIKLKFYDTLPLDFFWRQDSKLFVGPYLQGIGSQQTITYQIEIDSEVGMFYADYFENLWNDGSFSHENINKKFNT